MNIPYLWTFYEDRYVDVDGVTVRYWDEGSGDRTLVMLHGFLSSAEVWAFTIPALIPDYRVIACDLPGSGLSDKPTASYTYEYYVDSVRKFLAVLDCGTITLVGHSMGGVIATLLAADADAEVERLALVSPAVGEFVARAVRMLSWPFLGEFALRPARKLDAVARSLNAMTFHDYVWPEDTLKRLCAVQQAAGCRAAALRFLRNYFSFFGQRPAFYKAEERLHHAISRLHQPTFLCWGRQDPVVDHRGAGIFRERLPGVEFLEYDECGHAPQMEHASKFNEALLGFLTDRP
jgi:pimeloyl-ACP methyl ester carboxylesterase